jgi:hypothetical protein
VSALARVAAHDDVDPQADRTSRISFAAVSGRTYFIAIDGYSPPEGGAADQGVASLSWSLSVPIVRPPGPPNDAFERPQLLVGTGGRVAGTTLNARCRSASRAWAEQHAACGTAGRPRAPRAGRSLRRDRPSTPRWRCSRVQPSTACASSRSTTTTLTSPPRASRFSLRRARLSLSQSTRRARRAARLCWVGVRPRPMTKRARLKYLRASREARAAAVILARGNSPNQTT